MLHFFFLGGAILKLVIHGVSVVLSTEWGELKSVLLDDFSYFGAPDHPHVDVFVEVQQRPAKPIRRTLLSRSVRTKNSSGVDTFGVRELLFFEEVYLRADFSNEKFVIAGHNIDRVREICYLTILSRVGKLLDRRGLHRAHAMAVHAFETDFVCMLPSGGGKSTLLLHLLKFPEVSLISDDTPLIDSAGRVYNMPLKISVCDDQYELLKRTFGNAKIQDFRRFAHESKKYVAHCDVRHRIAPADRIVKRTILANGVRHSRRDNALIFVPSPSLFHEYFIHGIIGVGTPIFIELFWEFGLMDFLLKSKIFLRRLVGFNSFASKIETANFYIGHNPEEAAEDLYKALKARQK